MKTFGHVAAVLRSQLGQHEDPPGSNRQKYGAWYGMNGVAWCDIFQSWCFAQAGAADQIGGKFAYTPSHAQWFKDHDHWGQTPRRGALAFFDFGLGRISHIGWVEAVQSDGSIITIEGNTDVAGGRTGGRVMRKVRRANIVGYGYVQYARPAQSKPVYPGHVLQRGANNDAMVKLVQRKLGLTADGDFGPKTEAAVKAFQRKNGLTADGQIGPMTWAKLF